MTLSEPNVSISAARARSRSPAALDGRDKFFKLGKATRELSHNIIALARWAGSGRGVSRRSGLPVTRPGIADEGRAGLDPALQHLYLGRVREERGEVIFPQAQKTTGEIWGVGHRAEYTLRPQPGKRPLACRRVFDEAIAPKHCIVAEGDFLRGEKPSA